MSGVLLQTAPQDPAVEGTAEETKTPINRCLHGQQTSAAGKTAAQNIRREANHVVTDVQDPRAGKLVVSPQKAEQE